MNIARQFRFSVGRVMGQVPFLKNIIRYRPHLIVFFKIYSLEGKIIKVKMFRGFMTLET